MHPDWMEEAKAIVARNKWHKVTRLIPGGKERWESSWLAIQAYTNDQAQINLWFHDAARPFVSQEIIRRVAEGLKTYQAVTVAVPVTDTLYKVESGEWKVESMPDRKDFMRAQTPQAFCFDAISMAYARAVEQGDIVATDDVGVLMRYNPGIEVHIVAGEENNRKITYIEDLTL